MTGLVAARILTSDWVGDVFADSLVLMTSLEWASLLGTLEVCLLTSLVVCYTSACRHITSHVVPLCTCYTAVRRATLLTWTYYWGISILVGIWTDKSWPTLPYCVLL